MEEDLSPTGSQATCKIASRRLLDESPLLWSGWRESNPHFSVGGAVCCHYNTPAGVPLAESPIAMAVATDHIALGDLLE